MPRQADLARASEMLQSRISLLETPGAANVTLETLSRIAAAFKVGLIVKFVTFSEMLAWENSFSQDQFDVTKIDKDANFLSLTPLVETIGPLYWESSTGTPPGAAYGSRILGTDANSPVIPVTSTETVAHYSQVH